MSFCTAAMAQDNEYGKRGGLTPKYAKLQYAGSMGFISLGTGWDYGKKRQWETDVMLGFLPKYDTEHVKLTLTLKENFIPWSIKLGNKGYLLSPLTCGVYVNAILGKDFWFFDPSRYPYGYYSLSTMLRFNAYVGQRITYAVRQEKKHFIKSVGFFYEVSSNDLYIRSAMNNRYLKPSDYLHLSVGMKLQWL